MKYDLHCHSHYSDGFLSPDDLLARAKAQQVDVLALTDHDTIAGVVLAQNAAKMHGISLVPGIEFSSQWGKSGVHILGLGVDISSSVLQAAVAAQENARVQRAEQIAQKLDKCGISGALDGAKQWAGAANVGRPHFAQFLVQQGAVKDFNAAFKKYLGAGKPADVKYSWPIMSVVIEWINASDGVSVLAHPYKYNLTRTKMVALIKDFAAAGGQAVELINGLQSQAETQDLTRIVSNLGLAVSCGSDFHVPGQPWQELGTMSPLPECVTPVWGMPQVSRFISHPDGVGITSC